MEITQIVIASAIAVLTAVLALVGIQVFRILKEFKKTFERINKILEDMGRVTESIARPASSAPGLFLSLKTSLKVLSAFLKRRKKGSKK